MLAVIASIALAIVHLEAWSLKSLRVLPRSRWLSLAGGVSVAYVFVHLLPELARAQVTVERTIKLAWLEQHAYLLALAGLVSFHALELFVRRHKQHHGSAWTSSPVFWVHMSSFSVYNGLVGYLIGRREQPLLLFTVAMALHFLVTDYGLRVTHEEQYVRKGRWVVSSSIIAGCAVGLLTEMHPAILAALTGFLSGAIVLNVLKEELPENRESSLLPFVAGAVSYSALLLAM